MIQPFFTGFKKGTKGFGHNISTLVNSTLLCIVYLLGAGLTSITAKIIGSSVELEWGGTGEGVVNYNIYRCSNINKCTLAGKQPPIGDNRGDYKYKDSLPTLDSTSYTVTVFDAYGNESEKIDPVYPAK